MTPTRPALVYCLEACWPGGPPCGLAPGHPTEHCQTDYRFGYTTVTEWLHCVPWPAQRGTSAPGTTAACGLTVRQYVDSLPSPKPQACPGCQRKVGAFLALLPRTA